MPLDIRPAAPTDVPALARIRAHYVMNTHSVFATVPPSDEEVAAWVEGFADGTAHQLLVAVDDALSGERLAGYASTSPYRPTPAFACTAELSIYLGPDLEGRGVGSALYGELLDRSERHGTRTFLAGVALPNDASVAFHRKHGFTEVGTFRDYAEKWGRSISSTWFQRSVTD